MDSRSRRSECRTCHEFKYSQSEIILGRVGEAAQLGCPRCKLLFQSAGLFRERWLHLGKEEENLVWIIVSRKLGDGSGLVQTLLQWPSKAGNPQKLAIQITTEVSQHCLNVTSSSWDLYIRKITLCWATLLRNLASCLWALRPLNVSTSSDPGLHLALRTTKIVRGRGLTMKRLVQSDYWELMIVATVWTLF